MRQRSTFASTRFLSHRHDCDLEAKPSVLPSKLAVGRNVRCRGVGGSVEEGVFTASFLSLSSSSARLPLSRHLTCAIKSVHEDFRLSTGYRRRHEASSIYLVAGVKVGDGGKRGSEPSSSMRESEGAKGDWGRNDTINECGTRESAREPRTLNSCESASAPTSLPMKPHVP